MTASTAMGDAVTLEYDILHEEWAAYVVHLQEHSRSTDRTIRGAQFGFAIAWSLFILPGGIEASDWLWLAVAVAWVIFLPRLARQNIRSKDGDPRERGVPAYLRHVEDTRLVPGMRSDRPDVDDLPHRGAWGRKERDLG